MDEYETNDSDRWRLTCPQLEGIANCRERCAGGQAWSMDPIPGWRGQSGDQRVWHTLSPNVTAAVGGLERTEVYKRVSSRHQHLIPPCTATASWSRPSGPRLSLCSLFFLLFFYTKLNARCEIWYVYEWFFMMKCHVIITLQTNFPTGTNNKVSLFLSLSLSLKEQSTTWTKLTKPQTSSSKPRDKGSCGLLALIAVVSSLQAPTWRSHTEYFLYSSPNTPYIPQYLYLTKS